MNKIDEALANYEPGLPKYKPDVMIQLAEFEERIRQRKRSLAPDIGCLLYTSPSPRDQRGSGIPWSS